MSYLKSYGILISFCIICLVHRTVTALPFLETFNSEQAEPFTESTENETDTTTLIAPCPCNGQPEGLVMSHPSDCRAYYTCLGGINVRQSRCGVGDEFFHPYLRSCVERSKYLFFIPNIVETKDLCKVSTVFRAPAAENFDSCDISLDTFNGNNSEEEDGDDILATNDKTADRLNEMFPVTKRVEKIKFPWEDLLANVSAITTTVKPEVISTTARPQVTTAKWNYPTTPAFDENCVVKQITVQHFPGPCKAEIRCENGMRLHLKCQNTLTFT